MGVLLVCLVDVNLAFTPCPRCFLCLLAPTGVGWTAQCLGHCPLLFCEPNVFGVGGAVFTLFARGVLLVVRSNLVSFDQHVIVPLSTSVVLFWTSE